MRNKTKTKLRLKTTKLFLIVFSVLFFISAFVSINVIAQPSDLKLKDATITDKDATVTGNITDVNSNRVKDNVTFHKVNDDITYKLVVKNQLSEEITILSITDNNNNKNVTYEYDKHQNEKLSAGSSFDFYVTTRYNKSVTDMSKRDQNTSTNFIIKYQIKDKGKKESTIINPNTGEIITNNGTFTITCE